MLPKKPSEGYLLDAAVYDVSVEPGQTAEVSVKEEPGRGGLSIEKWDSGLNRKQAQGDASLQGAVLEIVNDNDFSVVAKDGKTRVPKGGVVQEITTDAAGTAKTGTNDLVFGRYLIREKGAPEGYQNKGILQQHIEVRENGVTAAAPPVKNDVITQITEKLREVLTHDENHAGGSV